MRSELVFVAAAFISNRHPLTLVASKATRRLHRPNSSVESQVVFQSQGDLHELAETN